MVSKAKELATLRRAMDSVKRALNSYDKFPPMNEEQVRRKAKLVEMYDELYYQIISLGKE